MPISVNLRHLEAHNVHLKGELPVSELDIGSSDEVIQATHPLRYDLEVQEMEDSLLVQGHLHMDLDCECVRCLKSFVYPLDLPSWAVHLPLKGEEKVEINNDCVDLTPHVREDILLEFPQHPLCNTDCRGLPGPSPGKAKKASGAPTNQGGSSTWAELNKLKF